MKDVKVTKEQFLAYYKVQQSGATNMFDTTTVSRLSGLDKPTILDIMKNYSTYFANISNMKKG